MSQQLLSSVNAACSHFTANDPKRRQGLAGLVVTKQMAGLGVSSPDQIAFGAAFCTQMQMQYTDLLQTGRVPDAPTLHAACSFLRQHADGADPRQLLQELLQLQQELQQLQPEPQPNQQMEQMLLDAIIQVLHQQVDQLPVESSSSSVQLSLPTVSCKNMGGMLLEPVSAVHIVTYPRQWMTATVVTRSAL